MKIKIDDIVIGERFRKDIGDLTDLAASIEYLGLLQPIGITPKRELIFGLRRLIACKEYLSLQEIEAREIDLSNLKEGEYAENEMRKNFTPSEQVAIMEALEKDFGNRQGHRTDRTNQLRPNLAEVSDTKETRRTREIAAKKAGFGGHSTAGSAKRVVKQGIPELVEMMDAGKISISAAEQIAKLPPEKQKERVQKARTSGQKIHATGKDKQSVKHKKMVKGGQLAGPMIPFGAIEFEIRPIIKRARQNAKAHPAQRIQRFDALVASELELLLQAWANGKLEPERRAHPSEYRQAATGDQNGNEAGSSGNDGGRQASNSSG